MSDIIEKVKIFDFLRLRPVLEKEIELWNLIRKSDFQYSCVLTKNTCKPNPVNMIQKSDFQYSCVPTKNTCKPDPAPCPEIHSSRKTLRKKKHISKIHSMRLRKRCVPKIHGLRIRKKKPCCSMCKR